MKVGVVGLGLIGGSILKSIPKDGKSYTTVQEHDRVIAFTSQLAHIVSSEYIQSETAGKFQEFSAGSFQDITRVAILDVDM